jgi:long-chain acyl-CoA synthetase
MRPHLATLLDDFRRYGGGKAIVRYVGNRRRITTYEEIARLAGRFAKLLEDRRVGPGDRVMLWAANGAEWVAVFYGCLLRGVLAVPLDAYGTAEFAARVAADVQPSLVVGDKALLFSLVSEWPKLCFEDCDAWLPEEEAGPASGLSRETPLQILFTSGTTGEPKGIVHTHGNVLASLEPIEQAARGYMRYERLVHPLRFLHTPPLSHVFGQMMGLWIPSVFAAEVHFESRLVASRFVETIRRERISVFVGVPRVVAMLKSYLELEHPDLPIRLTAAKKISPAMRWWRFRDIHAAFGFKFWAFVTGGGALPGSIEQFWNSLGFVLVQGYGMTETSALITVNHPFHVALGTVGKPLPGREVRLEPDGEVLVRGPMVSPATWSKGALHTRGEEWLRTGDLAEVQPGGELRFLGRKSEVIVTAAGVNLHPEDLEAAFEQEPEVAACVVVPVTTTLGPEPCAVLALRGAPERVSVILHQANLRLGESQRIHRWAVWPEPDLPRTSTGKVKRAAVAAWAAEREANAGEVISIGNADWLLELIARITGEEAREEQENPGASGDLLLAEELHLDSLSRVHLLNALEEQLGATLDQEEYAQVETLGGLRAFIAGVGKTATTEIYEPDAREKGAQDSDASDLTAGAQEFEALNAVATKSASPGTARNVYPRWPWWRPLRWLRVCFVECVVCPLVWLLAAPRVIRTSQGQIKRTDSPMLIVANHVTAYDVPLLLFALPRSVRSRTAVVMSGELLEDFRHARNMQPRWLNGFGPLAWLLVTILFNAFPMFRTRALQRSFDHVGGALDHGFHVIVFPEGTRSPDGALASFRPGIGLLVKQSSAAVLPMALRGLGEMKTRRHRWFRSGALEVRVGEPVSFDGSESEAAITERLQAEVKKLLA